MQICTCAWIVCNALYTNVAISLTWMTSKYWFFSSFLLKATIIEINLLYRRPFSKRPHWALYKKGVCWQLLWEYFGAKYEMPSSKIGIQIALEGGIVAILRGIPLKSLFLQCQLEGLSVGRVVTAALVPYWMRVCGHIWSSGILKALCFNTKSVNNQLFLLKFLVLPMSIFSYWLCLCVYAVEFGCSDIQPTGLIDVFPRHPYSYSFKIMLDRLADWTSCLLVLLLGESIWTACTSCC